ncbi:MAG: cystathionine gamma-lyase [Dactylosporangium sp.]|nr:cystathionine gamma-lyase [Dactylosporangium sp.]NNJ60620.1 cystathionine gamma-lyase [Dactylosporangium sp.]
MRPHGDDPVAPGDGTRCVRAGLPPPAAGQPFRPGPVFAAPYHLDPVAGAQPGTDGYGRYDNPTWRALETAIGELEGGHCLVFGSGMAAITGVLLAAARPGTTAVLPSDGYYATRRFAQTTLAGLGVRVVTVPTAGPYPPLDDASIVLLESPANPGLDLCDLAVVAGRAAEAGALVAVDNTTATPLGQRPLDLGAQLSVASATKALTGHSDLLLGYVCCRDPELVERIRRWRDATGAVPGPFEAWLAHRSLGTLDVRLARQEANASALTELLLASPAVTGVRWPGHPGDPAAALARRQMRRMPGIVTFVLPDKPAVDRFLSASRLIAAATSFGGLHTCADRRAQWGDAAPAGLVRLSCGIEDSADLVADLSVALAAVTRSGN